MMQRVLAASSGLALLVAALASGSAGARAVGMIVASAGSGSIMYGEHIRVIEDHLNVTLLTS